MFELDLDYNDEDIRLPVGCVSRANIDAHDQLQHVDTVGVQLCKSFVDDWKSALDSAQEMIDKYKALNP